MTHIDQTARVAREAELGDDVVVGPYSVIEKGAVIGDRTTIGAHVVIHENTCIGTDNEIHAGAQLGGRSQTMRRPKEPTYLRIGNGNVIREFVTMNRGFADETGRTTTVGNDSYFMAYSHVAHDCSIGDRVVMANSVGLAGHVVVEDDSVIGGLCGVHQFCRVGRLALVGGVSRLVKDAPPFTWVVGNPAECRGLNTEGLRRHGFDEEVRRALKQAYRILFRSGLEVAEAVAAVREQLDGCPEAAYLAEFVETSERGVVRGRTPSTGR